MKQTAVEWLETILEGQKDKPFDFDEWSIAFEHAKEMEKEQIIDAHLDGQSLVSCKDEYAEQYYNEIFKSE